MMDEEKQPLLWFCRVLTAAAAMFAALLAQVAVPGADVIRPVSAAYQSETDNYDATIPVRTDRFEEVTYSTVMREDGRLQIVDSNGGFVSDMLVVLVGGNLCYAGKDGLVAREQMVTYDGKKVLCEKRRFDCSK